MKSFANFCVYQNISCNLSVFANKYLKMIFGPKGEAITGRFHPFIGYKYP
jgi:hypothetical protein